jgi:hypothetical protein
MYLFRWREDCNTPAEATGKFPAIIACLNFARTPIPVEDREKISRTDVSEAVAEPGSGKSGNNQRNAKQQERMVLGRRLNTAPRSGSVLEIWMAPGPGDCHTSKHRQNPGTLVPRSAAKGLVRPDFELQLPRRSKRNSRTSVRHPCRRQ